MRPMSKRVTLLGLLAAWLFSAPAQAVTVDVNLFGSVTLGGTITGQSFDGQSVQVGFSCDTATVGAGAVFSGGVNFLNPFVMLSGIRYVTFTDEFVPTQPTTLTLVDAAPDSLALDFDVDGYVGITNRTESLTINFNGSTDFVSSLTTLPASVSTLGTGTGYFSLLYADDCQNYACGTGGIFFSGASVTINRLEIGVTAVPEPTSYALMGLGLLGMALKMGRRRA